MGDRAFGSCLLIATGVVFIYYTIWVIVLPFVDEDQVFIRQWFLDSSYALAIPLLAGVLGLILIGGFVAAVMVQKIKQKTS